MNKAEIQFISALTLIGIIGSYVSDTTVVEKIILIGGPFFAWLLFRNLLRRF